MNKTLMVSSIALIIVGIIGLATIRQSMTVQKPTTSPSSIDEASIPPSIIEQTPTSTGSSTVAPALLGKWTWQQTTDNTGNVTKPKQAGKFSITFNDDGSYGLTTDCNSASGTYTATAEGRLDLLADLAMTVLYCENSQENVFIDQLKETYRYVISTDSAGLTLYSWRDQYEMQFSR